MKWFWVFLGLYLYIYISKRNGIIFPPIVQYYLSDLLAVPVVASLSVWFMRWSLQRKKFVLQGWQVIFIVIIFSIVFEMLLPLFMKRYTADILDVLMYITGGLFFWTVMNK